MVNFRRFLGKKPKFLEERRKKDSFIGDITKKDFNKNSVGIVHTRMPEEMKSLIPQQADQERLTKLLQDKLIGELKLRQSDKRAMSFFKGKETGKYYVNIKAAGFYKGFVCFEIQHSEILKAMNFLFEDDKTYNTHSD